MKKLFISFKTVYWIGGADQTDQAITRPIFTKQVQTTVHNSGTKHCLNGKL